MAENLSIKNDTPVRDEQDIAIQITGLKKRYKLGLITAGTLKGDIISWWARKRGKEDPTLKIGAKYHGKNETFMALDGIDLTIYKGERIGIIGHNGAGKSTLLKLLARVTGPTEGEIKIDGRITSMLEVGTGFNGELTGRENIYLNGAILGMTKAEVDRKMEQIIDFSECRQFIDTPVKRYSSGMFVKLAFSVAAHLDSEIMIMDEVLAVGDMAFQRKCLEKMSDVSKTEGRTILYVSHNMNTIRQLCDRCIVLNHGKIIFNGDIEKAIEIYLGVNSSSTEKLFNDFSDSKRDSNITREITINSLVLQEKSNLIEFGSKMHFILNFESKINVKNIVFRFNILLADKTPVATSYSDAFDCCENNVYAKKYEMDVSNLAPGRYILKIILINPDNMGHQIRYDVIYDALNFTIYGEKELYGFKWDSKYWGNFVLDTTKECEK